MPRSTRACQQKIQSITWPTLWKKVIALPVPRREVTSQLGTGKIGSVFYSESLLCFTPRNSRQRWVSFPKTVCWVFLKGCGAMHRCLLYVLYCTIFGSIGNRLRILSPRICQSFYDVKPKAKSELCAPFCSSGNYVYIIDDYYTRWPCNFKGLSQDGDGRIFLKICEPLFLLNAFRMYPISAGSISLGSTFKHKKMF
jgi:hypothetical protein